MPIPKYNELYKDFLSTLIDGKIHNYKDIKQMMIDRLQLSENDCREMLPSGKQTLFENRMGWCRTYLKKAGLIESPSRAKFKITTEGIKLFENNDVITEDLFYAYPSFVEFKGSTNSNNSVTDEVVIDQTPQERVEQLIDEINSSLEEELLTEVMKMDPFKFEKLVVDLMKAMKYGRAQQIVTQKTNDEGIDGIVASDELGFDSIYIQAKRYTGGTVGRPEVQKFAGALLGPGAKKGCIYNHIKI